MFQPTNRGMFGAEGAFSNVERFTKQSSRVFVFALVPAQSVNQLTLTCLTHLPICSAADN